MEISHVSGAGPYITPYHWKKGLLKIRVYEEAQFEWKGYGSSDSRADYIRRDLRRMMMMIIQV